ncbi:MAG: CRISPR-associated protein Cas4 [Promethearchaeota archaeon]
MFMFTHDYNEPHQLNSFVYCKRKWYYQNRLKFSIDNSDLELGKYIHDNHWLNTKKRKEVYLISHKWKLKGMWDYLLEENGVQIPVEIKIGKCNAHKPFKNDNMQLMCYILLLEDHFSVKYTHGYILYVSSKCKCKVNVSLTLRKTIENYFKKIHSYLRSKKIQKRQKNEKCCIKCSYREYCWCK